VSALARMGSGSASRSIFGGYVEWLAGTRADGTDSHAVQRFTKEYWDLHVVVAVVDGGRKAVGSTDGMEHTRKTSPYHQAYLDAVDADLSEARQAIENRDMHALGRVAERSCLRMHADMMAADPALVYLKPASWDVIGAIRELQAAGQPVFFTADAGPNVKVFCLPEAVPVVRDRLLELKSVTRLLSARPGGGAMLVEPDTPTPSIEGRRT
jgi:diphosphomevalonate decarboxylase